MRSIIFIFFIGFGLSTSAQNYDVDKEKDAIQKSVKTLIDGWTEGDAQKFASPFADDADFMVWFGLHLKGKEEIAFGHEIIFKDFYANTRWDLKIEKIKFIGAEVALVYASGSIRTEGDEEPTEPDAVPLLVFNKTGDKWKIVALQNTPFAVNEFRANGDLKRMKRIVREYKD